MFTNRLTRVVTMVALCLAMSLSAVALNTNLFTTESRLASGQWVKITVDNSGIYEITADELLDMGFTQPENVAVYGQGGYMISEVLNNGFTDDIKPVSSFWQDGKLYFYAKGTVEMDLNNGIAAGTAFQRTRNPYSQHGYYFLTQEENPQRVNTTTNTVSSTSSPLESSLAFWFHENELCSVSNSGKDLLGEDMQLSALRVPYHLDNLYDRTIIVGSRAACGTPSTCYLVGSIEYNNHTQDVGFLLGDSRFTSTTGTEWFYDIIMPHKALTIDTLDRDGELILSVSTNSASVAKLDYAIITYKRLNGFSSPTQGQFDMWYKSLSSSNVIQLTDVTPDIMVWDVTTGRNTVNYQPQFIDNVCKLTLNKNLSSTTHLVAFSPSREQMKISGYESIENQNLHGMDVPDMLIVSCSTLMEQAKRVATLHQEYDGMRVEVVDQQQVFNEFSSGTPDAMAIRLLCKMLYDRNSNKFKNLLIFGSGNFDNRNIVQVKEHTVLTYESDDSQDKVSSYPCDDFYGMLDDNSGAVIESAQLRLGVGRIPSSTPIEAKTDVDKLVNYVTNPDYGVWRNNYLLMADEGTTTSGAAADIGLHVWHAEGVNTLIEDFTQGMHANKVYVETFPRDPSETSISEKKRSCTDGRNHIIESLNAGQYFMTYVGHAGGSVMAGGSKLWRSRDVLENNYEHLPIMTTACCNVARYDSNSQGIAEVMFHKPNGGVIALVTPARDAYANQNDLLNRAFVTAMFSTDDNGNMLTLGEAYKKSKLSFGTLPNYKKMSFFLMGDPAIKINYPRPLFRVLTVNGEPASTDAISLRPMQPVTVEAEVLNANGSGVDASFTGNATLTIYGSSKYFTSYTKPLDSGWNETRDIMLERPLLAQVNGTVENGHFTATTMLPRFELDEGTLQISVYAHKDGTADMVNGIYDNIVLEEYDEETAVVDNQSPVIEAMFLNDESSFAANSTVGSDAVLYVTATDDVAINMMKDSPGQSMRLVLDGNTNFNTVKDYVSSSESGRKLEVAFPLNKLTCGHHTLSFTVFDIAGNSAMRTIDFVVGQLSEIVIDHAETPAVEQVTFNLTDNSLSVIPQVDLKVTDAQGNLVWMTTTTQFPVVWDLKNSNGERVPAGLYKYFGTYRSANAYGGTDIRNIIIIDPLR